MSGLLGKTKSALAVLVTVLSAQADGRPAPIKHVETAPKIHAFCCVFIMYQIVIIKLILVTVVDLACKIKTINKIK